tara:strand:- start:3817 stop:4335 length:519 start_codon:yes stop_codon:yes gene_type:complete
MGAGTINTPVNTQWPGRNKISVSNLNTWEDLYVAPPAFAPDRGSPSTYHETGMPGFYIKQIYISANPGEQDLEFFKFSVRLYSENGPVATLDEEGRITSYVTPVEVILVDNVKVYDGQTLELLNNGPIKLASGGDKIQIQSNTTLNGWSISCWVETVTQNYNESIGTTQFGQ